MTNEQIIAAGQQIYDETEVGANTSERIGGVIKGIGQRMATRDTEVDEALTQLANQNAGIDAKNGYYTNSQAANESALTVTAPGYVLSAGGNIRIKMAHSKSVSSVTLNINNTGAKALYYNGEPVTEENTWEDGETVVVYYDGEKYLATNSLGGRGGDAESTSYNNTESGLSATNVQKAIDSIADKTQRLTTRDVITRNMVNPGTPENSTIIQGYCYTKNGTHSSDARFAHTDFIPVEYGKTYTVYAPQMNTGVAGAARYVTVFDENQETYYPLYNSNKENISEFVVTDSSVKYIVISGYSDNNAGANARLHFGCFLTEQGVTVPFEEWHEESHQLQYNDGLPFSDKDEHTLVNKGDVEGAVESAVDPLRQTVNELQGVKEKTDLLQRYDDISRNLVNPTSPNIAQEHYYDKDGSPSTSNNFACTNYIPVEYGKSYAIYAPKPYDQNNPEDNQGGARVIAAFGENYVAISGAGVDGTLNYNAEEYTVSNSSVKFIIITGASNTNARNNDAYKLFGCIETTQGIRPDFEFWYKESHQLKYNDGLPLTDKDDNTLVNKGNVEAALTPLQEEIEELQDVKDVANRFEVYNDVTNNLVNPNDVEQGGYTLNGTFTNLETYAHSDFIPVEPGKTYTIYAPLNNGTRAAKYVTAFNEDRQAFTFSQNAGRQDATEYSIPQDYTDRVKYIVISGNVSDQSDETYKEFGCFEGENIDFEYWKEPVQTVLLNGSGSFDKKPLKAVMTKADVAQAIKESKEQDTPVGSKVYFSYEAVSTIPNALGCPVIKIYFDDAVNNYMLVTLDKNRTKYYNGNHIFNFVLAKFNGVSQTLGDDVPALAYYTSQDRLNDYGGNHGNSVTKLHADNHGLTNADIGNTYPHSNGNDVVLLRVEDENYIVISPDGNAPSTVPNGEIYINNIGFTVDSNIDILDNGGTKSQYLCPVDQNLTQIILLNGKEQLTEDGDYTCDYLDIIEEYDVNMPTEIITVVKGHTGPDNPSYETPNNFFHVKNTYRFLPNMGCLVFKTFTACTTINLAAFAGTMSTYPFGWKAGSSVLGTEVYIPNSTHNEDTLGFDPSSPTKIRTDENIYVTPTLWVSNSKYWVFNSNTWADANNPVNRAVFRTPAAANAQCGYVVGYDKSMGVGKSLSTYTTAPLNISKAGKLYPWGINDRQIEEGDSVSFVMYRMFFRPDLQPTGRICEYHYELNGKLYVYLDYSDSINDVIVIDEKWDNKPIEIVESRNVTLLTDMYNGGIRVRSSYVNGETSFMVVRVG